MAKDRNRAYRVREKHEGLWTGLVLVVIGGALLAQKMGVDLPGWLFTWPMILVLIGLITGFKHGFRNPSWLIFMGIGAFFLADDIVEDINFKHYFWPVMIIGVGLLFMFRPKKNGITLKRWISG
jgi:hypothetical protein